MDNGASSYRRFLNGDEKAFDEIMEELFFGLVFFVDRYVHDVHAAEDIAMDAVSDLFVHRHRYNFKVSLKTYLYMLGKSRALNYLKKRKRERTADLSEANGKEDEENDLETTVLSDERSQKINEALAHLPDEMRRAVHLVYLEGMTYADAAKVMGMKSKQIDNLLCRAKKDLRAILGEGGEYL